MKSNIYNCINIQYSLCLKLTIYTIAFFYKIHYFMYKMQCFFTLLKLYVM